jgi:hypothetical protein
MSLRGAPPATVTVQTPAALPPTATVVVRPVQLPSLVPAPTDPASNTTAMGAGPAPARPNELGPERFYPNGIAPLRPEFLYPTPPASYR